MSEKYDTFDIGELSVISFQCPKCGTEVVFDLNTPSQFGAPYVCPTCRETYISIGRLFASWRDLFTQGAAVAQELRIRVRAKAKREDV